MTEFEGMHFNIICGYTKHLASLQSPIGCVSTYNFECQYIRISHICWVFQYSFKRLLLIQIPHLFPYNFIWHVNTSLQLYRFHYSFIQEDLRDSSNSLHSLIAFGDRHYPFHTWPIFMNSFSNSAFKSHTDSPLSSPLHIIRLRSMAENWHCLLATHTNMLLPSRCQIFTAIKESELFNFGSRLSVKSLPPSTAMNHLVRRRRC